jgi:hypothetical protein
MTVLYNELNFTCDRETYLQDELLKLYRSNSFTTLARNTFGELKRVGFNPNSGDVWLEDEDYNVLMVNNGKLDLFINTPYGGIEGFLSDILDENNLNDLHEEDKAYLLELKENA